MIKTYAKGAAFERDVLYYLDSKGFSVVRAPSSGGYLTPADIIAMKKGLIIALELKNHAKKPKLDRKKAEKFKEWCDNAGAIGFLGWKNGTSWLFLHMKDVMENRYEDAKWVDLKDLLYVLGIE